MTIGIDLGDVWSHYCTLNENGEVVDRGRFRTSPKAVEKWFTDLPPTRVPWKRVDNLLSPGCLHQHFHTWDDHVHQDGLRFLKLLEFG
jgi:hypothetical protein